MTSKRKHRARSKAAKKGRSKKQRGRGGKGSYKRKQRGYGEFKQLGRGRVKDYFKKLANTTSSGIKKISKSKLARQTANTAKKILLKTGYNIVKGQDPKTAIKLGAKQFGEVVGADLLNTFVKSM